MPLTVPPVDHNCVYHLQHNDRAVCSVAMQADNALQCFLEVIAQIAEKRTEIILRRKLPRLFMAYPNYRLALGFGLHHGWAIEGSLGSMHKVRTLPVATVAQDRRTPSKRPKNVAVN
jgi:hypothetical protein